MLEIIDKILLGLELGINLLVYLDIDSFRLGGKRVLEVEANQSLEYQLGILDLFFEIEYRQYIHLSRLF